MKRTTKKIIMPLMLGFLMLSAAGCAPNSQSNPGQDTPSETESDGHVTGVSLNEKVVELAPGDTFALIATISPSDAKNKNVTWTSTNEKVVKVKNGLVTAISVGRATISVTTEEGEFVAYCNIKVTASEDVPPSEDEDDPDAGIQTIDFDESDYVSRGTSSGYLIDINVNDLLSTNNEYLCTFSPSSGNVITEFRSSNEEVATIEKDSNSNSGFTIKTHKAGDSIIKIYDNEGILVYRNIIRVRTARTIEQIGKTIYDNDVYKGVKMMGNHRLTILNYQGTITAQVKGSDDYEADLDITFSAEYTEYVQSIDAYEFKLSVLDNPNQSQTKPTYFYVSRVGDNIKLYYQNGLLNIFYAAKYEYLHAGLLY